MHINEPLPIFPKLLGPFMDLIAVEIEEIVKIRKNIDAPCAINEIFADLLRCRTLIEAKRQKECIGTLLACALLKQNAPHLAKLRYQGDRIREISALCGLKAEPLFSPDGEVETIEKTLIKHATVLPIAYRCAKHTRSLLSFFSCTLVSGVSFDDRVESLANFARDKQRVLVYAPSELALEFHAKRLAQIMHLQSVQSPPSKENMLNFLKKSDHYEFNHQKWVESEHFDTLYALAKIEFRRLSETKEPETQKATPLSVGSD